jgi:hypothetical protein
LPILPNPAEWAAEMRALPNSLVLAGLWLLCSCRVAVTPTRPKRPPPTAEARATNPPCAILFSESNCEFLKTASWSRGPENYTNLIYGLKQALAGRGVPSDLVSEEDLVADRLRHYRVLYVADTFSISAEAEDAIRGFIRHGGVLVGINEVGRYQNDWVWPWHYEDIFGVKALKTDADGTARSPSPDLYRFAALTAAGANHPITRGLGEPLDFGPSAVGIWVTQSTGATVLAEYSVYSAVSPDHDIVLVTGKVVAVSVNPFGDGTAVWISPNVHDGIAGSWAQAGATMDLLARCAQQARLDLVIPPRPPQVILGVSQIGYAPRERKRAIIRIPKQTQSPYDRGTFAIFDAAGTAIREGALEVQGPSAPWGDCYYSADFTDVSTPGNYRFVAELSGERGSTKVEGGPIRIATNLWSSLVVPSEYSFFYDYRCGETCHSSDPIRGGYHDATGDYSVRMWSMPHVAFGIAENILATPALPRGPHVRPLEELQRAVDWLIAMQDETGVVQRSVKPPNDTSPIDTRPAKDPTRRVLERGFTLNYQTTYVAGLAHAALALRDLDPERCARATAAAKKAHERLAGQPWNNQTTGEIGNFIWGCVELYKATGDGVYLERAKRLVPVILDRQFLDPRRAEAGLRGDFFDLPGKRVFGDRQYKKFHAVGLYLGLVEILSLLKTDDPLRTRLAESLEMYFNEHLLRGATITAYGQMITGLEPDGTGRFLVKIFPHMDSWIQLHGLNVDHFALGLVALKYADQTGREDLREFARAQAQWVAGANPLGYCMVDYLGWRNPPPIDDSLGTGRFIGGIPNGIVGDPKDRPMWGTSWGSREYWIPHNAYLLAIAPLLDAVPEAPAGCPAP